MAGRMKNAGFGCYYTGDALVFPANAYVAKFRIKSDTTFYWDSTQSRYSSIYTFCNNHKGQEFYVTAFNFSHFNINNNGQQAGWGNMVDTTTYSVMFKPFFLYDEFTNGFSLSTYENTDSDSNPIRLVNTSSGSSQYATGFYTIEIEPSFGNNNTLYIRDAGRRIQVSADLLDFNPYTTIPLYASLALARTDYVNEVTRHFVNHATGPDYVNAINYDNGGGTVGIDCTFYRNASDPKEVNKTISSVFSDSVLLKKDCSFVSPVLIISKNDLMSTYKFNYVYIQDFGRYYYVTEIISVANNVWEVHCKCDVLMSFKSSILSNAALIDRQENENNPLIPDKMLPLKNGIDLECVPFKDGSNVREFTATTCMATYNNSVSI